MPKSESYCWAACHYCCQWWKGMLLLMEARKREEDCQSWLLPSRFFLQEEKSFAKRERDGENIGKGENVWMMPVVEPVIKDEGRREGLERERERWFSFFFFLALSFSFFFLELSFFYVFFFFLFVLIDAPGFSKY